MVLGMDYCLILLHEGDSLDFCPVLLCFWNSLDITYPWIGEGMIGWLEVKFQEWSEVTTPLCLVVNDSIPSHVTPVQWCP